MSIGRTDDYYVTHTLIILLLCVGDMCELVSLYMFFDCVHERGSLIVCVYIQQKIDIEYIVHVFIDWIISNHHQA